MKMSLNVNRINNCCPSYATKALHLASWPNRPRTVQNQNYYKRAILNDRKRKSSRVHVLCDDVVLFRLRSKKSQSSLHWDCIPFFVQCNQSENQFKENLKMSNRTKDAQWLSLVFVQWTQKLQRKLVLAKTRFVCTIRFSDQLLARSLVEIWYDS